MARIRSIKPEFFSSETLAKVPRATRLTFIGLWTYVDDNGVGIDNDRLITAALYPLDDDFVVELKATGEDLAALERLGVIRRYAVAGKRYLYVTNWGEHQKVSHPGKPRYPLPPEELGESTEENESPSEQPQEEVPNPSGDSPEPLRPEVGAGSREQGAGKRTGKPDAKPLAPLAEPAPDFDDFWQPWPRKVSKADAEKAWKKAITKTRADPAAIVAACQSYADRCRATGQDPNFIPYPATWLNRGSWADDLDAVMPLGPNAPRPEAPPLPPHCGHCDPQGRWIDRDDGTAEKCPDCHPDNVRSRT